MKEEWDLKSPFLWPSFMANKNLLRSKFICVMRATNLKTNFVFLIYLELIETAKIKLFCINIKP